LTLPSEHKYKKETLKKLYFRCLVWQKAGNYEHAFLATLWERRNIMANSRELSSTRKDLDKYIGAGISQS